MKYTKAAELVSETAPSQETCEIIELMVDQVELLSRTFNLIHEVCQTNNGAGKLSRFSFDDLTSKIH